ncbi:MAG: DUF4411 family protein, partial [Chloroflexi bacterium]|nr:DUF4411 family protein [Chloroflexota bacterium]
MTKQLTNRRKQLYGFAAVAFAVCICLIVIFLAAKPTIQNPQSDNELQATTSPTYIPNATQTTEVDTNNRDVFSQNITYDIDSPTEIHPINNQRALQIAKPYIEAYALANNRTVVVLNVKVPYITN